MLKTQKHQAQRICDVLMWRLGGPRWARQITTTASYNSRVSLFIIYPSQVHGLVGTVLRIDRLPVASVGSLIQQLSGDMSTDQNHFATHAAQSLINFRSRQSRRTVDLAPP